MFVQGGVVIITRLGVVKRIALVGRVKDNYGMERQRSNALRITVDVTIQPVTNGACMQEVNNMY